MTTLKKKLTITRETISVLRAQTGIKAGDTCQNACGKTTDKCQDVANDTKCSWPAKLM